MKPSVADLAAEPPRLAYSKKSDAARRATDRARVDTPPAGTSSVRPYRSPSDSAGSARSSPAASQTSLESPRSRWPATFSKAPCGWRPSGLRARSERSNHLVARASARRRAERPRAGAPSNGCASRSATKPEPSVAGWGICPLRSPVGNSVQAANSGLEPPCGYGTQPFGRSCS